MTSQMTVQPLVRNLQRNIKQLITKTSNVRTKMYPSSPINNKTIHQFRRLISNNHSNNLKMNRMLIKTNKASVNNPTAYRLQNYSESVALKCIVQQAPKANPKSLRNDSL